MKKIIFIVIVAVVVVGSLKFLKEEKAKVANAQKPQEMLKSVKTVTTQQKTVSKRREFLAQLQASKSAYIASKFSATIKKIYVKENDIVKKGQLLISLDDSDIKTNLNSLKEKQRALKIDLLNAKKILDRNKKLLDIDAISKEAYDNSNVLYQNKLASYKGVDESIKQVQSQLKYLNIKAPFDAVVGSKLNDEGSLAISGKAILTLNSNDQKMIFSFVDGDEPIIIGQKVFMGNKLIGEIAKRYDDAKNSLLVAEVKPYKSLPFANKSYKTIEVQTGELKGCAIPTQAILNKKDKNYILVYSDGAFKTKEVDVKLQNDDEAIISECLEDKIAVASEAKLAMLPTLGRVILSKEGSDEK